MQKLHLNPENGMVFHPESGCRFRVNAAGMLLLKGWQTGASNEALLQELMKKNRLTRLQAERLLHRFIRQCELAGLQVPALSHLPVVPAASGNQHNSSAA